MNNYCSNCGSENKDQNNKFCGNCGMPISHADTLSTVFIPSRNPDLNRNDLSVTPYWKKVLSFQGTIRQRDYIFSFLGIIFVYAIFLELKAEAAFLIKPGVLILICLGLSASGISLKRFIVSKPSLRSAPVTCISSESLNCFVKDRSAIPL